MRNKKFLIIGFTILVILVGIATGIFLVRRRQYRESQASIPGGQAKVFLSPATGIFTVGDTINTNISFNTGGVAISGVTIRLTYNYSGTTPELSPSDPVINPVLLSSGDWNCPVKKTDIDVSQVIIDISCVNFSSSGYQSTIDTRLASFDLQANREPTTNPISLVFNAQKTVITRKTDGEDVLLTPETGAQYTIEAIGGSGTTAPTATPTSTPYSTATPSPSPSASASAEPTLPPDVPATGISLPTLTALTAAFTLLAAAFYLAF